MVGLFNYPITAVQLQHFVINHSLLNNFAVRSGKNSVLNEPIRFEEIVIFIIIPLICKD